MTTDDNPRVHVPPPLIYLGLLTVGLWLDSEPARLGPLQLVGAVASVAGLALTIAALGLFRRSDTRPEPWQPAKALVRRGPYRITRNPMYLGMTLTALGVAMLLSSLAGAILALVATILVDRTVIAREEAYLQRRFGADYAAYARKVRKWL